jgi:hypothetical protein
VRLTLTLGVLVSVAANILHANPNPISQAIAAWAPLALLLAVELISRIPVDRKGRAWLRITATTVIAGIAAWVSYWHMVGVAHRYGETGITPYLLPISVDGLIVVASISLVEINTRLHHQSTTTNTTATNAGSGPTAPAATPRPVTTPAGQPTPTTPHKAPGSPAVTITETANRLAATYARPAPTPPPPASNHHASTTAVQESLL